MDEERDTGSPRSMMDDLLGDDTNYPTGEEPKEKETPPEEPEQPTDTDTDTEPADTETETEGDQYAELQKQFDEAGLGGYYKDLNDLIQRTPDHNRYIAQKEQENADLKRQIAEFQKSQQTTPPSIDWDKISEDPVGELAKLGFVRKDDVEQTVSMRVANAIDELRAQEFVGQTKDFAQLEDRMMELYRQNPGIANLPKSEAVRLLYLAAKGYGDTSSTVVEPSKGASKKDRAKTDGGKGGGTQRKPEYTLEDLEKMSIEELDKIIPFDE